MIELKDPEIKLFGKKIAFPENGRVHPPEILAAGEYSDEVGMNTESSSGSDQDLLTDEKIVSMMEEENEETDEEDEDDDEAEQETTKDCETGLDEKDQTSTAEESDASPESDNKRTRGNGDSTASEASKIEKDQGDATDPEQKILKKPDKILPCPRCNSMDTKFCYYNNYNVNQPRHFCKSCQRYWTAGGTMRNVPVGAGRRKNKNSASHCRHITISEALEQAAQMDAPNGYHHQTFKPNGTVLSFGPNSPLCESMASVLNLSEKKAPKGSTRNGYYKLEQGMSVPSKGRENGDDCSTGSLVTTSNSMVNGGQNGSQPVMPNMNGFPSPIPCLPGVPWPFPWNAAVPMPAICPSGYPMPFYQAPYWNYGVPGPWSIPWLAPTSPTANQNASGSGPNSPLGKHSRNGELLNPSTPEGKQSSEHKKSEGSVLVPKTLRIDDPDEAAKSSIWATLGIKYDSVNRGGIFNAFQSKANDKKHVACPSPVLQANPAALSRSLSFQENA